MLRAFGVRLSLSLVWVACACEQPEPPAQTRATPATLDARGDVVLLGVGPAARAESDALPSREIVRWDTRSERKLPIRTRAVWAALGADATWVVSPKRELWRIDDAAERFVLDRAHGKPAPRADGSVVVARIEGPGQSDLWLVGANGGAHTLAPAPGPDDSPIALPDGRVAFVSGRTTVASLFVVDPDGGEAEQLTNHGLVAGKPLSGFVPPPLHVLSVTDDAIFYDAGKGELWRVTLGSKSAERVGGPP